MNVGIYIRLSEEDKEKIDKENESESIKNQRNILLTYIKEHNFNFIKEYVDDGYTGLNFDRPKFNEMIKDIKNGIINCVITKDFSRLGREHSKFSYYTEIFFPEHNIRYIAINDNYDSYNTLNDDIVPFKSVFNDFYSKDVSKKVRSALYSKMKNGEYIGSKACYGYKKDPNNKNHLVVDPYASLIVKRIFSEFIAGKNMSQIALNLTNDKIDIPSIYNPKCVAIKPKYNIWKAQTIKYILINELYTGNMIQGKVQNINYKVKKRNYRKKNEWYVVQNTHEPIIEKEIFEQVQRKLNSRTKFSKHCELLLVGLLRCKECNTSLSITNTKSGFYLNCKTYLLNHKLACSSHCLNYKKLEQIVIEDLKKQIEDRIINYDKINTELNNKNENILNEILNIQKSIQKYENEKEILYNDRLTNIITIEEYVKMKKRIDSKINLENQKKEQLDLELKNSNQNFSYDKYVNSLIQLESPDKALLNLLINKIEINKNKEIEISYNFY